MDRDEAIKSIDKSLVVSAAAGTGKTSALVDRYFWILKEGSCSASQIIAITFTDKAANEMRERIRLKLSERRHELPERKIVETLDSLPSAPISTVHSFCLTILREKASLLNLDPQFQVIDPSELEIFTDAFLKEKLYQRLENHDELLKRILLHLDLNQILDIVKTIFYKQNVWLPKLEKFLSLSPLEIHRQIQEYVKRNIIELLTNLLELPEAKEISQKFPSISIKNETDTLYQAILDLNSLKNYLNDIQGDPFFTKLEDTLKKIFNSSRKGNKQNWYSEEELEYYRKLFSELNTFYRTFKEKLIDLEKLSQQEEDVRLCHDVVQLSLELLQAYREELYRQAKIDFDGIEQLTVRLLETHPDEMITYLQKFKHLLVDEFQDINPIQYKIIELILSLNPEIKLFFVGDEKQSIYRFRGAEVEIFNQLYLHPKYDHLALDVNYRSSPQLMEFYNYFFEIYLGKDKTLKPFEANYPIPIKAHKPRLLDQPAVEYVLIEEQSEDNQKKKASYISHAIAIGQKIKELVGKKIIFDNNTLREAQYGDITILLRSRTHQSEFEQVLRQMGIPYFVVSGIGFYNQREIIDLINFLRILINPLDFQALVATLRSPFVGISDRCINYFYNENGITQKLYDYISNPKNPPPQLSLQETQILENFIKTYHSLSNLISTETTATILQAIVNSTNYLPFLASQPNGSQKIANVKKLIDLALEWESNQSISPIDFISRIQIYRTNEIREGDANLATEGGNAVRIMTIHAAKGLDFPIVMLPIIIPRKPSKLPILPSEDDFFTLKHTTFKGEEKSEMFKLYALFDKERNFAEEKRLFYVAATRAKDFLFITVSQNSEGKQSQNNPWIACLPILEAASQKNLCIKSVRVIDPSEELKGYKPTFSSNQIETDKIIPKILPVIQPIQPVENIKHLTATEFAERLFPSIPRYLPIQENLFISPTTLGSIVHQLLAWWDFEDIDKIATHFSELIKPYLLSQEEQLALRTLILDWFEKICQPENPLIKLLSFSCALQKEVLLCGFYQGTILEGNADLLIENEDGNLTLVDFKTDHLDNQHDQELIEKYFAQLRFYAFILDHSNKATIRDINLYFVRYGKLISQSWTRPIFELTQTQIEEILGSRVKI